MRKILIVCFVLGLSLSANSQKNQNYKIAIDSINNYRSKKLSEKVLGSIYKEYDYVVFTIKDKFVIIFEKCDEYNAYYYEEKFNFKTQKKEFVKKDNLVLNKSDKLKNIFNSNICNPSFKYASSYSGSAHGTSYIYFMKSSKGIIKCEQNMPMVYKSKKNNKSHPIDADVFNYLLDTFRLVWK